MHNNNDVLDLIGDVSNIGFALSISSQLISYTRDDAFRVQAANRIPLFDLVFAFTTPLQIEAAY